jgi:hypothetical protein
MNRGDRGNARSEPRSHTELTGLVYELLDAHEDTASLAAGLGDIAWLIHLDYLRALQRRAREILARLSLEDAVR